MSIKTKLLIFALSISLIPISIITTLYYFNARSTIERQTLGWLTAVAESKKVHTLSLLDGKKGRVVDFSSDGFIRDSLETISSRGTQSYAIYSLNRHLKVNKKPLDPHITAIAVLDINGNVVASTNDVWIGKDMSKENIFMSCVTKNYGETYIDKSYNIPYLNENCIFISSPLTSKQVNKTIGVIINAYDIAILDEITTSRAGMGESGEVLLGMRKGDNAVFLTTLKYAPDMPLSKSVPLNSSGAKPMRLALKGLGGAIIAPDYRKIAVVAAFQYISGMDWGLVAKIDKKEVFAPITRLRIFTIILGCISSIVAIIIAIIISKRVTRPIQKLVEGTRKIASGDLGFKIIARSKDEIGYLSTSFNNMTSQLGKSKKQVEDYAHNLEKKVEDKIGEIKGAKEYTENLIETAQDAIISIYEDGIINVWNKSAEKIFGYSKSDIIGQPVSTIIPEKYKHRHQEGIKRFLKTRKPVIIGKTIEVSGLSKEGFEMPIEMSMSCHKIKNKRYTFTAIIRDITENKKVAAERKRLFDELRHKNKEMEQIIYVTSHDLRSPLLNIQGFSKELAKDIEQVRQKLNETTTSSEAKEKLTHTLEEDIPDAIKFILTSSSKMDTLLSGLLRISRMGRVALTIKRLDMNKLMANVVGAFEYKIKEAGITLHVDELPSCSGDEVQIGQVFSNLLDNALKYLDPNRKGVIRISGTRQLVYYVEDNGIGVKISHQTKIFEIFHRLNPGDGTVGEGLGLTIVRGILDRHGGKIWVESDQGKGSKFFVSLPE